MTTPVHVLPVGKSLIGRLVGSAKEALAGPWEPGPPHPPRMQHLRHVLQACTASDGVLDLTGFLGQDAANEERIREQLALLDEDVCAETKQMAKQPLPDTAIVVLIATDTDDGLRAAALLGIRFAVQGGLTLRYLDNPLENTTPLRSGGVYVVRIPGLDLNPNRSHRTAATEPLNHRTWWSVGELGRLLARVASDPDLRAEMIMHLSGGYKALMPYLLVMTEGILSVAEHNVRGAGGDRPAVSLTAQVIHEEGEQPIRLPIRSHRGRILGNLEELRDAMGRHAPWVDGGNGRFSDVRGSYLEDERVDGRRHLTPMGLIMTRTLWAISEPKS